MWKAELTGSMSRAKDKCEREIDKSLIGRMDRKTKLNDKGNTDFRKKG